MGKPYQLGFICGRFQMLHLGHLSLIDEIRKQSFKPVVLVGSSDKERTSVNPFSFKERKAMIQKVYPDQEVLPLPDIGVGDVPEWGDYLFQTILKHEGRLPDLFLSGKENKIDHWFSKDKLENMTILRIDRAKIDISATRLREYLIADKKEEWMRYVPKELYPDYDFYRSILLSIK